MEEKINSLEKRIVILENYINKQKKIKKIKAIVFIVLIILLIIGYSFFIKYIIDMYKDVLGTDIFNFYY